MQDYREFAEKNGITLLEKGACQCCGARTERGIHECLEIFNLGFPVLDYGKKENHRYRFLSVDAHTLQHPEIHGRWNNHFHLSRQHLMFSYAVPWDYQLSPLLSDSLKRYKPQHSTEVLTAPLIGQRGDLNIGDVQQQAQDASSCKKAVEDWAKAVYIAWKGHHSVAERVSQLFLKEHQTLLARSYGIT